MDSPHQSTLMPIKHTVLNIHFSARRQLIWQVSQPVKQSILVRLPHSGFLESWISYNVLLKSCLWRTVCRPSALPQEIIISQHLSRKKCYNSVGSHKFTESFQAGVTGAEAWIHSQIIYRFKKNFSVWQYWLHQLCQIELLVKKGNSSLHRRQHLNAYDWVQCRNTSPSVQIFVFILNKSLIDQNHGTNQILLKINWIDNVCWREL